MQDESRAFSPARRRLLAASAYGASLALVRRVAAAEPLEPVLAETDAGRVRGQRQGEVCVFRGIPYAGDPGGAARFKAPPLLKPWKGVRDALDLAAPSVQAAGGYMGIGEPAPQEDCLTLNIWTPAVGDGRHRPVMFYLHGGGFVSGSAGSRHQDGTNLARNNDVVVVQCNHRLGLLGYLYLADLLGEPYADSGNQGLLDIVAALAWTKRNIASFGGDPTNCLVWGESGGGAKTSAIYAMPAAAPYFHKASIESGPGLHMTPREDAARTARYVLERLGLKPGEAKRLLTVPAEQLLKVQLSPPPGDADASFSGGRHGLNLAGLGRFAPVVDGRLLPAHPFDPVAPALSADKPLICGYNHDEAVFFQMYSPDRSALSVDEAQLVQRLASQYGAARGAELYATYRSSRPDVLPAEILMAIQTAGIMGAGSIAIAEAKARQGRASCYAYTLTEAISGRVPGTNYPIGAMHAMDIRYKFDNVDMAPAAATQTAEESAAHVKAGKNMSRLWAAFARDGRPAAPGQPDWPAYELTRRATYMIAAQCHVVNDPYPQERRVWERLAAQPAAGPA